MSSLFVKIFLGFVVVVILVGTSLETSSILANYYEVRWQGVLHSIMPMEAEKCARMYEQSGKQAVEDYLDEMQKQKGVRFYFFDEDGNSLIDRGAPEIILKLAKNKEALERTAHQNLSMVDPRRGIGMRLVPGPSGKRYVLAFQQSPNMIMPVSEAVGTHPYLRLLVVGLLGTGLCLLLTLHITRPIRRLRAATQNIASGKLKTRVDKSVRRRHDEIGMLGQDFDQMANQIEALVAAQRELLGDVSHELRSPLARMIVALGLLKQASPDEAVEYVNRINTEAERLDKMIGQLLTLTRIESGAELAQREKFDFTNLVQEVAADGDFEARAHHREVKVTRADTCTILGIPEMLRSAIENVVRNAIRYTPEGTTVEIALERLAESDEKVLLTIRDHGPGVPKIMLAGIFQPFQRVPTAENNSEGAGLGLAIADRVVQMHNGQIRALNADDGGLIVEITLPISGA
ncbi:MAG TPA: ATP-binding protein [Pyrinomonadaceae bacterium]|nr:ATP-binding protein [Pyrinomonadaceae bacterium]